MPKNGKPWTNKGLAIAAALRVLYAEFLLSLLLHSPNTDTQTL